LSEAEQAYVQGRREATDELSAENKRLLDMINQLHQEVNAKNKQLSELTYRLQTFQQ
jgi:predicted nuclease with TOPRIM domain